MLHDSEELQSQISPNHRRVISVRLRLLEESCLRLLDLFRPIDSILTSRRALPQERVDEVRHQISKFGAKIAKMKSDLGLERSSEDPTREARALTAAMITGIEELYPHYLRGYGTVPEPLALYLESQLNELSGVMNGIAQTMGKPVLEVKAEG